MATKRDQTVSYLVQQLHDAWHEADQLRIQLANSREEKRKQVEHIASLNNEIERLKVLQKTPQKESRVAKIKSKRKQRNGRRLKIKDTYKVDGDQLRKLMKRDNIDTKTLAGVLEVTGSTICNWLNGRATTMAKINAMADCFQVDVSVLTKSK